MSTAHSALPAPLDTGLGGVLLANMLEAWLTRDPHFFNTAEVADELEDCRTPPEQTCLHLSASVNAGPSATPSGEHRASVRVAGDGAATGLERARDPHPRPGPGEDGHGDDEAGRLQDLGGDVSMGQVGAVFALEASRLARSNLDWHRLLELCALTQTLVIDEDGCYDPADFNDSLVLGLKGTMAQAELHFLRARLQGGKLNKAKKGELRFPARRF